MDWATVVGAGLASAVLQAIVSTVVWTVFRRQIELLDSKIAQQRQEIVSLHEDRIRVMREEIAGLMPRGECAAIVAQQQRRLDDGADEFRGLRQDIALLRADLARVHSAMDLLLRRAKVVLEGDER